MQTVDRSSQRQQAPREAADARVLEAVSEAISRLRFGGIELTVHDGHVVQLEVRERQRFV
jgi:hypothetical protein